MGESNYLYCIIGTDEARNFGPIGIGGGEIEVTTLGFEGISCVISRSPQLEYTLNRENLLAHQKVIEKVMKEYTVLPVRFSTIADSPENIRGLLRKRQREFKNLLSEMEGKIELGLKAMWSDMKQVFREIQETDNEIRKIKYKMAAGGNGGAYHERISLGTMVASALQRKKDEEAEIILSLFRDISVDIKSNKVHGDNMFLNAAFLIDGIRAAEFDSRIRELDEKSNERMKLKYVGPVPIFNFVNIIVEWNS
ncbi:MAG: GvpL/GvpF family gas vesicle protein [Deltaproteobacteria bacterium]|nr:GvpL/GvpF family gas vesicle protein [Deltaproteobacteria bacterium]